MVRSKDRPFLILGGDLSVCQPPTKISGNKSAAVRAFSHGLRIFIRKQIPWHFCRQNWTREHRSLSAATVTSILSWPGSLRSCFVPT